MLLYINNTETIRKCIWHAHGNPNSVPWRATPSPYFLFAQLKSVKTLNLLSFFLVLLLLGGSWMLVLNSQPHLCSILTVPCKLLYIVLCTVLCFGYLRSHYTLSLLQMRAQKTLKFLFWKQKSKKYNIFYFVETKIVSATSVACARKRANIQGNNVFCIDMFPHLQGAFRVFSIHT